MSQWSTRTRHIAYFSPGSLSLAAVAALLLRQLLRLQSSSTTNIKRPSDIFPPRSRATQANEKHAALQRDALPMALLPPTFRESGSKCPQQRGTLPLISRFLFFIIMCRVKRAPHGRKICGKQSILSAIMKSL